MSTSAGETSCDEDNLAGCEMRLSSQPGLTMDGMIDDEMFEIQLDTETPI